MEGAPAPPAPAGSVVRILVTLLLVALVIALGILIWYLFPWHPRTVLVTVVFQPDSDKLPRVLYAEQDRVELTRLAEVRKDFTTQIEQGKTLDTLPGEFATLGLSSGDTLIFHLTGHGLSLDGKPYLAGSDFDLDPAESVSVSKSPRGIHALDQLLKHCAATAAGRRLLILDCSRLVYDPRLGITRNEFARLATEAVQKMPKDDGFYVLLASGNDAPTTLDPVRQRSHFSQWICAGLGGKADQKGDGSVSLAELYQFVWNEARRANDGVRPAMAAYPVLLQASRGEVPFQQLEKEAEKFPLRLLTTPPKLEIPAVAGEGNIPAPALPISTANPQRRGRELYSDPGLFARNLTAGLAWQTPGPAPQPPAAGATAGESPKVDPAKGKSEPQPDAAPTEGTPAPMPPATPPATPLPAADPSAAPPAEPKAPAAPDPANPQAALAAVRASAAAALLDLWQARDELADRGFDRDRAWLPLDFAPCGWQALNADLLEQERLFRDATTVKRLSALQVQFVTWTKELRALGKDLSADRAGSSGEWRELNRIQLAWGRFRESRERDTFLEMRGARKDVAQPVEISIAQQAVQSWHEALAVLPWLGRWRAEVLARDLLNSREDVEAADALVSAAVEFQRELQLAAGKSDAAGAEALKKIFTEEHTDLRSPLGRVRKGIVDRVTVYLGGDHRALEVLLSSPLVPKIERAKIYERLGWLSSTPSTSPAAAAEAPAPGQKLEVPGLIARDQEWERQVLDFEAKLWELIDSQFSQEALELVRSGNASKLPPRLRDKYRGLSDKVKNPDLPGSQAAARLLDPRDWRRMRAPQDVPPVLNLVPPKEPPSLRPSVEPRRLELAGMGTKKRLRFKVKAISIEERRVTVEVRVDPALQVFYLEKPVSAQIAIDLDSTGEAVVELDVAASSQPSAGERAAAPSLTLTFKVPAAPPASVTVECELPRIERVDLVVRRERGTEKDDADSRSSPGALRLQPFPNLKTGFQFALVNNKGQSREITAELYAVPDDEPARTELAKIEPGKMLDAGWQLLEGIPKATCTEYRPGSSIQLRPAAKLIAQAKVKLGVEPKKEWFRWEPPAPAAPPPDKEGKAAPPPPPPQEQVPATRGMVCVLREAANPDQVWVHWLEISPFAPRDFLKASAEYSNQSVRVTINVREEFRAELPLPISLDLENAQGGKPRADLQSGVWMGVLEADLPPDGVRRDVHVAVQGYPRAFRFLVTCEPGGEAPDQQFRSRVKLRGALPLPRKGEIPPMPPQEIAFLGSTQDYSFGQECDALQLRMEIDTPPAAFGPIAAGELRDGGRDRAAITLGPLGGEPQLEFFASRRVETTAEIRKDDGFLKLLATVSDHQPVLSFGFRNRWVPLELSLKGNSFRGVPGTHQQVRLLLDTAKPTVQFEQSKLPDTIRGSEVEVILTAKDDVGDQVGIDRVELGVDAMENGKPMYEIKAQPIPGQSRWRANITAEQLKAAKGSRLVLLARAYDKVGNMSEAARIEGELLTPPPVVAGEDPLAKPGVIEGVLTHGGQPYKNPFARVWLEKAGGEKTAFEAKGGGGFRFENVPAGKYVLKGEGSPNNKTAAASVMGVQPVPSENPRQEHKLELK